MPIRPSALYKTKTSKGDRAAMIKTRSTGDFFSSVLPGDDGCCGTSSGWVEYSARLKIPVGLLTSDVMEAIARIAKKYGRGEVYLTARLGMEIPGVSEESFEDMEEELAKVGVDLAGCGPRMRSVVACKGTICLHGNIDTFRVAWEIDQRFNDSTELPHKFKVGIAGCPSFCSKPQLNDVGLVGVYEPFLDTGKCDGCGLCSKGCYLNAIRLENKRAALYEDLCVDCGDCAKACVSSAILPAHTGVDVYAGGRWGREKQIGILIARFLTETDAIELVGRIKEWYREEGNKGERLGTVIHHTGVNVFQEAVLPGIKREKWVEIVPKAEAAFQILK